MEGHKYATPYEALAEAIMRAAEVDRCLVKTHLIDLIEMHFKRWWDAPVPIVKESLVVNSLTELDDLVGKQMTVRVKKRDYSDGIKEGPKEFIKALSYVPQPETPGPYESTLADMNKLKQHAWKACVEQERRDAAQKEAYLSAKDRALMAGYKAIPGRKL